MILVSDLELEVSGNLTHFRKDHQKSPHNPTTQIQITGSFCNLWDETYEGESKM